MRAASLEDLESLPGLGPARAARLHEALAKAAGSLS
jgi:DNA uptake protein ComE-like DNA-binding protein